jgi:serine protease Do
MTPRILTRLFVVLCLTTSLAGTAIANENVYDSAVQSTVYIVSPESAGSGVLVDRERRLVITNHHVVGDNAKVTVFFPIVLQGRIECDSEYYHRHIGRYGIEGKVLATDPQRDLAVIELAALPDTVKALEPGRPARPGQIVHSIGNPDSSDAMWVYTAGYVRANYYKRIDANRMQVVETSSPVNPGDSGGPILDDSGKLVGLTQSYMIEGRLVSNGVDITEIAWFLNKVTGNALTAGDTGIPETEKEAGSPTASPTGDNSTGLKAIFGENAIASADLQR